MNLTLNIFYVFFLLISSTSIFAQDIMITQKNKTFSEHKITINQGDRVIFENRDPMFHNVYSLSSDSFDLGGVPKGGIQKHTFNVVGEQLIKCAIHPFMSLHIKVK